MLAKSLRKPMSCHKLESQARIFIVLAATYKSILVCFYGRMIQLIKRCGREDKEMKHTIICRCRLLTTTPYTWFGWRAGNTTHRQVWRVWCHYFGSANSGGNAVVLWDRSWDILASNGSVLKSVTARKMPLLYVSLVGRWPGLHVNSQISDDFWKSIQDLWNRKRCPAGSTVEQNLE